MCGLDDCFEEPVGLFDFVPVEEVCLAELELFQAVCLDNRYPEDIGGCKKPAPPGGSLVRNWGALDWDLDVEDLDVGLDSRPVGKDVSVGGTSQAGNC